MKRRDFLKGAIALPVVVTLPVIAKPENIDPPINMDLAQGMFDEMAKAREDMLMYGHGFMQDGKHVPLSDKTAAEVLQDNDLAHELAKNMALKMDKVMLDVLNTPNHKWFKL